MTVTAAPFAVGRRRRRLLPLQLLYAVFLPVWFALAIAGTMGLANTDARWAAPVALLVWTYPILAVFAVAVSHVLWNRSQRYAHLVNAAALPWVLCGAVLLLWMFTAGG